MDDGPLRLALSRELTQPKGGPQQFMGITQTDVDNLLKKLDVFSNLSLPEIPHIPPPQWFEDSKEQFKKEQQQHYDSIPVRPYIPSPYTDPVLQRLYEGYFHGIGPYRGVRGRND